MNILILQGPNMNLLGLKSSQNTEKLTLAKLNKAIRLDLRSKNVNLKILQTHKEFQALNFLQRNRSWAEGLLLIPTSWARNNYNIYETLKVISLKTSIIYFSNPFSFGTNEKNSIISGKDIKSFTGNPIETCLEGLNSLLK